MIYLLQLVQSLRFNPENAKEIEEADDTVEQKSHFIFIHTSAPALLHAMQMHHRPRRSQLSSVTTIQHTSRSAHFCIFALGGLNYSIDSGPRTHPSWSA